jgi:hypothetical protein
MTPRGRDEVRKILGVSGGDHITIGRQQNYRRVHHVGSSCAGEELAGGSCESRIERTNLDPGQRMRKARLTRPTAPHLADYAGVGGGQLAGD